MTDKQKRVLVVDDEEDLTWSMSKHLSKDHDKYELICVNSGKKALEVLSQLPVDLVITDIRMPDISGLDLLVQIKDFYPDTKVIIMTAYGSSEIQAEANKRGCLKYIEKPFEISEMRQLILDGIKDKKGFEGKVSDFQLTDLIQMNCLGRLNMALSIVHEDSQGYMFFEEGNIVHAETGDLEGEEAFYEILSWEGGNFTAQRDRTAPKESILKGWQSLLLEGMRRLDEGKQKPKLENEDHRQRRLMALTTILNKFLKVKGVLLVTIFDSEGFPTASQISPKALDRYDMKQISPVISSLIKQIEITSSELNLDDAEQLDLEFKNMLLILTRIPDKKQFFIVIAEGDKREQLKSEIYNSLAEIAQYV